MAASGVDVSAVIWPLRGREAA